MSGLKCHKDCCVNLKSEISASAKISWHNYNNTTISISEKYSSSFKMGPVFNRIARQICSRFACLPHDITLLVGVNKYYDGFGF